MYQNSHGARKDEAFECGGVSEIPQHTAFLFNLKTIKVMRYCKKFNILPTTTICLACEHCLPPNKRNGRMCKNEVTHEDKADALILYCKLLKYLRTTGANIVSFKRIYNDIVKDRYVPYITRSVWKNELCFGLEYHPIYGYNMAVSFNTLKDVKL